MHTGHCTVVLICMSCGCYRQQRTMTPCIGGYNPCCHVCGEDAVERFTYDWTDVDGTKRPDREQKCPSNNPKGFSEDYWVFWEQVMCRE